MFTLIFVYLCLLGCNLHAETKCIPQSSEFKMKGDYLLGGLFDVHHVKGTLDKNIPEAVICSSQQFTPSSYRRFQMMRFSIEEINHSTSLLPNVTLGYEIFDHCSDTKNFPSIFSLMSVDGSVQPWKKSVNFSKVIAMVGTYTSTATLTVAPLFMMDLVPMISYGASSSVFSRKQNFPSFLRTVHTNKDVIEIIWKLLEEFKWTWVAFLYIDDDYGRDGLDVFKEMIKNTKICLAFSYGLREDTNYSALIKQMELPRVNVIIVFTTEWTAEALIESAIQQNVTNKVWIAVDAWSLHKELPKKPGIRNIGTVLGIAEPNITIPGFEEFISSFKAQNQCKSAEQDSFCNQMCNCSSLSAEEIITEDPSFNFPVYSAVYAVAHALHGVLQCEAGSCNKNIKVYPHMVLKELTKSDFTLLDQRVQFDKNGDPKFGSYDIVFWNENGDVERIGSYTFHPSKPHFDINGSKIHWHEDGKEPESFCSKECPEGYVKKQEGFYKCCFSCKICPKGTYLNITDPYTCKSCKDTEWSAAGSTSCNARLLEYIPFSDPAALGIIIATLILLTFTAATSVLFALNYNTPVVKSAGGPMCFVILGCISLCSISVFFYFGEPTVAFCILRFLPFLLFFTVCLACFVVRSFQIVCIFQISTKFPNISRIWTKYHTHWIFIVFAFFLQAILLITYFSFDPPKQFEDKFLSDRIILGCDLYKTTENSLVSIILASVLLFLSFCFSYAGKNLPKNYNEAKAITFCMLLLILIWISFATFSTVFHGKYINLLNALAVLLSLYSFLLGYFFPKSYIILFKPQKNTEQYFQDLIQCYTRSSTQ